MLANDQSNGFQLNCNRDHWKAIDMIWYRYRQSTNGRCHQLLVDHPHGRSNDNHNDNSAGLLSAKRIEFPSSWVGVSLSWESGRERALSKERDQLGPSRKYPDCSHSSSRPQIEELHYDGHCCSRRIAYHWRGWERIGTRGAGTNALDGWLPIREAQWPGSELKGTPRY